MTTNEHIGTYLIFKTNSRILQDFCESKIREYYEQNYKEQNLIEIIIGLGGLKPYPDNSNKRDLVDLWQQINTPPKFLNYRTGKDFDSMLQSLQELYPYQYENLLPSEFQELIRNSYSEQNHEQQIRKLVEQEIEFYENLTWLGYMEINGLLEHRSKNEEIPF